MVTVLGSWCLVLGSGCLVRGAWINPACLAGYGLFLNQEQSTKNQELKHQELFYLFFINSDNATARMMSFTRYSFVLAAASMALMSSWSSTVSTRRKA